MDWKKLGSGRGVIYHTDIFQEALRKTREHAWILGVEVNIRATNHLTQIRTITI
jgi:hypothetical protein